jgi:hypothetical protein
VDDEMVDQGFGVNIVFVQLRVKLGLFKPKPSFYNFLMVKHFVTKLIGLI